MVIVTRSVQLTTMVLPYLGSMNAFRMNKNAGMMQTVIGLSINLLRSAEPCKVTT